MGILLWNVKRYTISSAFEGIVCAFVHIASNCVIVYGLDFCYFFRVGHCVSDYDLFAISRFISQLLATIQSYWPCLTTKHFWKEGRNITGQIYLKTQFAGLERRLPAVPGTGNDPRY